MVPPLLPISKSHSISKGESHCPRGFWPGTPLWPFPMKLHVSSVQGLFVALWPSVTHLGHTCMIGMAEEKEEKA